MTPQEQRPAPRDHGNDRAVHALALLGAVLGIDAEIHGALDLWGQRDRDARYKHEHGTVRVYAADGEAVTDVPRRPGAQTCTLSQLGRRAATRHVATYCAGQLAVRWAVTRALGYQVPIPALAAGALVNGVTHWFIDRGPALHWLATKTGHTKFIQQATVVRQPGQPPATAGPGTAYYALDQALHRAIGVAAAAVTTWLALRSSRPQPITSPARPQRNVHE